MKITLLVLFALSSSLYANIQLIKENANEVILSLDTKGRRLSSQLMRGKQYSRIELLDSILDTAPGYPEVPFNRIYINVPLGKKIQFEILNPIFQKQKIAYPLNPLLNEQVHNGTARSFEINTGAYQKTYGDNLITIEEIGFAGSDKIATLRWSPVKYEAIKNQLVWTESMTLRVKFIESPELLQEKTRIKPTGIASLVAINPGTYLEEQGRGAKTDLLIAHESYRTTLTAFVEWKRQAGHEVREYYVQGKKNSELKAIIKKEYSTNQPPTSTLLVGSIDQLPSWKGSNDNTWTDFDYQILDNDKIPDLSLGRIPAQSVEELAGFLEKVVAREKYPRNINEILLTAGKDTSLGCPNNVSKVGVKLSEEGNPVTIIKKYRTEVSSQQVWDGYNSNPNIIVYDGHGNREGMTEIPLLKSNLSVLSNAGLPILLDIACLNANWKSSGAASRNFAETILLDPKRGLAGILGSGGSGNGHEYFQTIGRTMATARKQMNSDSRTNEIGRVIWAAKIKANNQDRTYWNYYGDPTSSIWESTISN